MDKLFIFVFLVFGLILPGTVDAQNGTVRGTVIEDATGEPLYGVTILIVGTSDGTTTDFDGNFDLELPAGTYDLRISYVSFRPVIIEDIEVKAGEITVLDNIRLQKSVEEMGEVVVTAELVSISEAALLTVKKKSANIIDGISAETFRRVGVSDASEAIKRVTGVSVQDGKYVYVRGLGDRYSNTLLNSIEIPSLDPDKNSLQIDIFPTSLIDNMVVSKTAVASMPADFAGGIVNIETKDFPIKPIYEVSASLGYNPEMHFNSNFLSYEGSSTDILGFDNGARALPDGARGTIPTPINGASSQEVYEFVRSFNPTLGPIQDTNVMNFGLGLTLGDQFDVSGENTVGYILTATYKNSSSYYGDYRFGEYQNQSQPTENGLIYSTTRNGTISENNILFGGLAGLSFKTEKSKYKLTGMHLQNGEKTASHFFIDNSGVAVGQSGYLGESFNLDYGQRQITNFLLSGTHYFDNTSWQIDWKISPTISSMEDPDIRKTTYTLSNNGGAPRFNAGAGGFPSRIWRNMDEVNLGGRLDVTREYELFGEPSTLKFGASYTYKERDYEVLQYTLQSFGSWPPLTGDPSEVLQEEHIYGNGNGGNLYYLSGNPEINPNQYNSNSTNAALYLSNEFNLLPELKAILGLRVEDFVLRHTGRDALFAQGDPSGNNLDNEKVLDALDFFPSANFTYFLSDDMNLRLSYARTIARPTFKELSFAQILDPVSDRIFNGGLFAIGEWDGNLHETRIDNVDMRWESYIGIGQLISLSLFYKSLDDPIELVRIQAQPTSSEFQPRNVGDGEVYGAEFEVIKTLDFISPLFEHLRVSANLTMVNSSVKMTEQEFEARKRFEKEGQQIDDTRSMAGQAPYIVNAGLSYDNPGIGLEAGFFYNVKGKTLVVVGGGLFPNVYSDPFHSLNFNLNKSFGNFSINLSLSNIFNEVREELYHAYNAEDQIFSSYRPYSSASLGIEYSF